MTTPKRSQDREYATIFNLPNAVFALAAWVVIFLLIRFIGGIEFMYSPLKLIGVFILISTSSLFSLYIWHICDHKRPCGAKRKSN